MISKLKNELRKQIKSERKLLEPETKKHYDELILKNILKTNLLENADVVFVYLSTATEVDTWGIVDYCLEKNIKLAVPRCIGKRRMNFYYYDNNTALEESEYGIREPVCDETKLVSSWDNAVCIVPGLSFDKSGYRLGYGGGFYDTFLEDKGNITTIGICYNFNIRDKLPTDIHDKNVNYVITEKNTEVCNGQQV